MTSHEPPLSELSSSAPSDTAAAVVPLQLPSSDEPTPDNHSDTQQDELSDYVSGFKLVTIAISMALALFLVLIDTMVISTVCSSTFRSHSFTAV